MKKMTFRGLLISDRMLNREEVKRTVVKEGSSGIGKLVVVCLYLKKHFNAIGRLDDLRLVSEILHTKETCLRRWVVSCGIFDVDRANGLFTYPYLRHMFGLEDKITEREIYLVKTYGNSIRKDPEKDVADDARKSAPADGESKDDKPNPKRIVMIIRK